MQNPAPPSKTVVHIQMDTNLVEQINDFCEKSVPRVSKTAMIEAACRAFMEKNNET